MKSYKLLWVFICISIVMSCLPFSISADNSDFVIENGVLTQYTGDGGNVVIPDGVTTIDEWALSDNNSTNASKITSITIPPSVKIIKEYAFAHCTELKSVSLSEGLVNVGTSAFWDCPKLTEIKIPSTLKYLSEGMFHECTGLTKITLPNTLTKIINGAFSKCYALESITIPDSVIFIGAGAFSKCTSLKEIHIPKNVSEIDSFAFDCASSLTKITVSEQNPKYKSVDGVLFTKDGKKLIAYPNGNPRTDYTIPSGTTEIAEYSFYGFEILKNITLSQDVELIEQNNFLDCSSLKNIKVDANNKTYKSINGILFSKDEKTLITYPAGKSETTYSIPQGVTVIGEQAFMGNTKLKNVTFPDSLLKISMNAFANCTELEAITMPGSIKEISSDAFCVCSNLKAITLPDHPFIIGNSAFRGTAFYNDESNWENNVLYIGHHLIRAELEIRDSYSIKPGTIAIAEGAFSYCENLINVIIPNGVSIIGTWAFSNCESISSIIIPEGVTYIGWNAFYNCPNLLEVTLPDSITYINGYIFEGSYNVTVHCNEGSYAWQYAVDHGYIDPPVTEPPVTTVTETSTSVTNTTPPETSAPITETEDTTEISEPVTDTEEPTCTSEIITESTQVSSTIAIGEKDQNNNTNILFIIFTFLFTVIAVAVVLFILNRKGIVKFALKKTSYEDKENAVPDNTPADSDHNDDISE
ncbi:MAG: hypothetical protein E7578_08170 [Ruminococcaceae bacterium]|nr:hypothetical protein [Oscillospiraceae bacterium]